MRLSHFGLALILLAAIGCSSVSSTDTTGSGDNSDKALAGDRVLAEREYVNHAWGYAHSGVVIMADGRVFKYEYPHGGTPWPRPEGAFVSASQLAEKYAVGRVELGRAGADTVAMIAGLIERASKGTLSERDCRGADMGSTELMAYLFDETTSQYRAITLRVTGDCDWHNTAAEAIQLAGIVGAVIDRHAQ